MISVRNLSKEFIKNGKSLLVLKELSFDVKEGEFVSILGPTGCGKTTLLNILAGLEKPTSGKVLIDGKEVCSPSTDVGIVFQDALFFPWKTALQNVELALKAKGIHSGRKEIAKRYLQKVGLEKFADFYPKELSGGMKQKLALARLLALDSKVFLMDEPFAALDAHTKMNVSEELLKIWDENRKTVLFVTHLVEEAVFLSDRIVLLSPLPGRIVEIFHVPLPRPRGVEIRVSREFEEIKLKIMEKMEMKNSSRD